MTNPIERLARRLRRLEEEVRTSSTQPQLAHSAIEDGAIQAYETTPTLPSGSGGTPQSTQTMQIGKQHDGAWVAAPLTGPVPPQPDVPVLEPVIGGIKVRVTGAFTDSTAVVPMDFSRWEIHVVQEPGYQIDLASTLYGTIESPRGGEFTLGLPYVQQHIRIVARSLAGKGSEPSDVVSATPRYVAQADLDPDIELGGPSGPDGSVPATSPDVAVEAFGIGGLIATWDAVENADPVTYQVFADDAPIADVPDPALLVTETTLTSAIFNAYADGTKLPYGVPTYVRVLAVDTDGPALVAGAEDSALPRQATTEDIAASYIYAGQVQAAQIASGSLAAQIALVGQLTVGEQNGRRIVLSPGGGMALVGADGEPLVSFPTSPDAVNTFRGDIVADGITAMGRASFRGNDNEISRNSSFTLASGTTKPANSPIVGSYWKKLIDVPRDAEGIATFRLSSLLHQDPSSSMLWSLSDYSTGWLSNPDYRLSSWDFNTGQGGAVTNVAVPHLATIDRTVRGGLTKIGSEFFAIYWQADESYPYDYDERGWWIAAFNSAGTFLRRFRYTGPTHTGFYAQAPGTTANMGFDPYGVGLATDGTNLIVVQAAPTAAPSGAADQYGTGYVYGQARWRFQKINPANGAVVSTLTETGAAWNYSSSSDAINAGGTGSVGVNTASASGLKYGSFDLGAPHYVVFTQIWDSEAATLRSTSEAYDTTGAKSSLRFPGWTSDYLGSGIWTTGAHFDYTLGVWYAPGWSFGGYPVTRVQYAKRSTSTDPFWVAYTWYDSDPGGTGTHETQLSPKVQFNSNGLFGGMGVRLPVAPADAGDPDSPDSARWYVCRSATEPTDDLMRLMPTPDITTEDGVYSGSSFIIDAGWGDVHKLVDEDLLGSAAPAANSFPDGFAGEIRSGIGGFVVRGDGTGDWPILRADLQDDIDTKLVEVDTKLAEVDAQMDGLESRMVSPIGHTMWWEGPEETIPTGWMKRDGRELAIATYPTLYSILTNGGTTFPHGANTNGSGAAGTTHFRLPNLTGRVEVGLDPAVADMNTLGETGGADKVTLTANESGIQAHTHSLRMGTSAGAGGTNDKAMRSISGDDGGFRTAEVASTNQGYGSATYPTGKPAIDAHENRMRYKVGIPIIKVTDGVAEDPELVQEYAAKRYSFADNFNDTSWNANYPSAWTQVPGMSLTIPSAPYDRTAWIDALVVHGGSHNNRFAVFLDGAQATDTTISKIQSSGSWYDWQIVKVRITIPANTARAVSIFTQAADSNAGATFLERSLVVDVLPGVGNEHTLGSVNIANQMSSVNDSGYQFPALRADYGWAQFSPDYRVAYRKLNGVVFIEGMVKSGVAGPVFHLPPGFRPATGHIWNARSNANTSSWLEISVAGDVMVNAVGNNGWVSLTCSFLAA